MKLQNNWTSIMVWICPAALTLLCVCLLTLGCATSTQITSAPPGAKAYVNDRLIGDTPCVFESRSGFPESSWVRIEKPGYKSQSVKMRREYRADESLFLLIPGIIPYFFSARYEDQENFVLEPGH
jgi:hypothetical protein